MAGTANKYRAQKTEVDGILFDSKKESVRWGELRNMERAGEITNLQHHSPVYKIEINGVSITRFTPDFQYERDSKTVVEDVKSTATKTRAYVMRRKLMLAVFGIAIVEV